MTGAAFCVLSRTAGNWHSRVAPQASAKRQAKLGGTASQREAGSPPGS